MIALLGVAQARGWLIALAVVLLTACQSLPTDPAKAVDLPGEIASERYAYLNNAINDFSLTLKADEVNFGNIEFSHKLFTQRESVAQPEQQTQKTRIRYLAENLLAKHGPYEFLHADTHNNRIEFRSADAPHHLSISIQPTVGNKSRADSSYVVADMFGQVSLRDLSQALPYDISSETLHSSATIDLSLLRLVTHSEFENDSSVLRYLNNLPRAERDREDIMRLRALLTLKLNQTSDAHSLIESGIVRFPHNPSFLVMAEHLTTQSDNSENSLTDSLNSIIDYRFSAAKIDDSRQLLDEFLEKSMFVQE